MLEHHYHNLVRQLAPTESDSRIFLYLKLADSNKTTATGRRFIGQTFEAEPLLAVMQSGWIARMLAEAVVIRGSGSYAEAGWCPSDSPGTPEAALRTAHPSLVSEVRPNMSICGQAFSATQSATEVALAVSWCGASIERYEISKRGGRTFGMVAFIRPDQFITRPMPSLCDFNYTNVVFACGAGGSDGLWVAPRQMATQLLNVVHEHTRCDSSSKLWQCSSRQALPRGPTGLPPSCHSAKRRYLTPSCCGPGEFLLQHALSSPSLLPVDRTLCLTSFQHYSFNFIRTIQLTDGPLKGKHVCDLAMHRDYDPKLVMSAGRLSIQAAHALREVFEMNTAHCKEALELIREPFELHPTTSRRQKASDEMGVSRSLAGQLLGQQDSPLTCSTLQVTSDWRSLRCADGTAVQADLGATNALSGEQLQHHEIFRTFNPASFPIKEVHSDIVVDFLGVRYPRKLYCNAAYMSQPKAHAIRTRQCTIHGLLANRSLSGGAPGVHDDATLLPVPAADALVHTAWPVIAEEYFEYVDMIETATAYRDDIGGSRSCATAADERVRRRMGRPFVFVELGAGYGHWTLAGHAAVTQTLGGCPFAHRYLLVDVMPEAETAILHLAEMNAVATNTSSRRLHFHAGFIADANGLDAKQQAAAEQNRRTFTKLLLGTARKAESAKTNAAAALPELLAMYNMPRCIDMVDIDIQGNEYSDGSGGMFSAEANLRALTERAKRVHIGLHGSPRQDAELIRRFEAHGWRVRRHYPQRLWTYYPNGHKRQTHTPLNAPPYGSVLFADGVLSLENGRVPPACRGESSV
jgi:hypothetical protein